MWYGEIKNGEYKKTNCDQRMKFSRLRGGLHLEDLLHISGHSYKTTSLVNVQR